MMLLRLGANTITLTLNESITLSNPEYVLVIREDHSKKQVACKLGPELSSYPNRANQFTVTVKTSPVALNAEIYLKDLSFSYFVFERADADTFNYAGINTTDIETLTGLVERGLGQYVTTATAHTSYADTTPSKESYGD